MATKKKRKFLAESETLVRKKTSRLLRPEQCCRTIRLLFSIAILSTLGTPGILTDGKITLIMTIEQHENSSEGFLRLLAPENWTCAGAVQIYHNGRWGNVCDDLWDMKDAEVVCQQLKCGSAKEAVNSSAFGIGSGEIWLTNLECSGKEKNLSECSPGIWGKGNCTHKEDAGVICTGAPVSQVEKAFNKCTWKYYWEKGDDYCIHPEGLRLADGDGTCEGRVEIKYNGSWGTVCDDGWDIEDARVVCNQLKCRAPIETSGEDGNHTKGSDTSAILLSNVECRGDEIALWGCRSPDWLEHDCHHKEDVWVKCGPLIVLPGYDPIRDDFVAVVISIALTVLLIIVTTLLVYQIRRKDEIPLEYYGQHRLGYGDYGIYEDIDYAGVKRLSQISHVSEAESSLGPGEYYADIDGEKGSLKGSLGFRKEYYDDVEGNDVEMQEINGGGKEGYDDIGSPTEPKWKSAQKPGTEYYDDVDDPDSLKQGIARKPAERPSNEYYDDVDDPDTLKEGITGEQAQKPEKEYYDDVDDLDSVKEGKLQAGEVKDASGRDYENVPEHSSALAGRGHPTGKPQAGGAKKSGGGDYENVPEHSSALSGRRGLSTGTLQAGEVKDASGRDYENVPEHSSALAGSGHPTGKPQAGGAKKSGGGDYENVPEHSSALSGRRGLSTGTLQAGEVKDASGRDYENVPGHSSALAGSGHPTGKPQAGGAKKSVGGDYENVPEHSSALSGRRGLSTGTSCDPALNPKNEYYDDVDDPDSLKEDEALQAGEVDEASRRDYENVPESSAALLGRSGLPSAPGREK
ncbi:uncharacterized protein [Hemitrygon akajei]|uniref:uncharacterized protein isoform X2 n=1 Tax=Hemitrygon akajei TaxID=2704970 RepID=UPI003BF97E96